MGKFCIVAQGGGMVACYHAGVIAALQEKFGLKELHCVIATSGAAATYSYLISNQQNLIEPIWIDLIKSGKFAVPWKFPPGKHIMNIDFLIDEMIKKRYPLDIEALKNSSIDLQVGVTDANTAESRYFSKNAEVDFFELLRASCAVPYFGREKVLFNGRYYYDGIIASVTGLEKTLNEENILMVLTRPPRPLKKMYFLRKILRWLLIRNETPVLQKAIWDIMAKFDAIPQEAEKISKSKNLVIIQPKKKLPILRVDTSLDRLQKTIKQGYNDTINHPQLESFFAKLT